MFCRRRVRFGRCGGTGLVTITGFSRVVPEVCRQRSAAGGINDRHCGKLFARGFFHRVQTRAFVDDDFARTNVLKIPGGVFRVGDEFGFPNDPRVVDDHVGRRDVTAKMVAVNKHESRVVGMMGKEDARRSDGRPPDVAAAETPANPGRRPFNARHPDPAIVGIVNPIAIVITSPRPRFIADPIPAAIGPDPITVAVRPPPCHHAGRVPATAVETRVHPGAARRQRGVKIRVGVNLHRGGDFEIRLRERDARI